jgi:hypothetical protein
MNFLGAYLTLWVGPTIPTPAPAQILEALDQVSVTHNDQGRSGFQISFQVGRSETDLVDYALLNSPQLKPFSRVLLMVTFSAIPQVLMDGMITNQQLSPGNGSGNSTLTITGEDVSIMMDMEEKSVEHPAQNETVIANKIIASYPTYGLIPNVIPPTAMDIPLPIERTPVQQGTDLQFLQEMAQRYGYVFYVTPGPAPLSNMAYWGPPVRIGLPQKALSVNMGQDSNVHSINFQYDAMAPETISSSLQDRTTNQSLPIQTFASTRIPPLVTQPALLTNLPNVRKRLFTGQSGLNYAQAFARAQGMTDASSDRVVTATGELDAFRYGNLLAPRGLVDLRGAGYSYNGAYYVKSVTHTLKKGEYKQQFTLTREGVGALLPVVRP